ncbi:Glutamate synthase [NADPH] large chain [hydrothermal vent metagenome]|uniref:Glutamate synthase [NADPH] large chain n=1 Tax=hydrothermal vent metagenome TaxID=652676 RepID=A0A1W1E7R5_9ZZZZ
MHIAPELVHLIITVVFSFLVGLELRTYRQQYHAKENNFFFGTARTYSFVGILGYIFYRLEPVYFSLYIVVLVMLSGLFWVFYKEKVSQGRSSILPYVVMLCVYAFGPLTERFALWMPSLLFVLIIFLLNAKQTLQRWDEGIRMSEFETLGKMVLLSAVILPLLPNTNTIPYLPISPFKIWLAVVVISGISYGGYLVQKYLFPSKGYFLTGIFGGTYSSTATTVVLARKAKTGMDNPIIDAAIIAATSMMYLRLLVVAAVFNFAVAKSLLFPFLVLAGVGMIIALFFMKRGKNKPKASDFVDKNPLELGTAFLFASLFVLMMLVTHFVIGHYGNSGLQILSFVVGFTDIDPFILSLLTGKYTVTYTELVMAIMIAAGSNNLLKALYALWFGGLKGGGRSAFWVGIMGIFTIVWAFVIYRY